MPDNPQTAVLLRTLVVNGCLIPQGSYAVIRHITDNYAVVETARNAMAIPRHLIAVIPSDSPRVHKHKKHQK